VLGVYPSALHVRWTLPEAIGGRHHVNALAVDVEPVVFWDGADQLDRIEQWKHDVGFVDGTHGRVGPLEYNGSSGLAVMRDVLNRLDVSQDATWFSDCVPLFFVKRGRGSQGAALDSVYDKIAQDLGFERSDLPPRPPASALVAEAVSSQRERLRSEILASGAPIVVTLGEEARHVLVQVCDASSGDGIKKLNRDMYGGRGLVSIDETQRDWFALKHPGQRSEDWAKTHANWPSSH
jgi:hypothetical protein